MTTDEILKTLSGLLGNLLGDDSIVLAAHTRRHDVGGWDSLNYVNFIVAVEMEFGIKFRVAEVESFETVGQIVDRVIALTARRS